MKITMLSICLIVSGILTYAQETRYETKMDIPYYSESIIKTDEYIKERCVLDIYYPVNKKDFATIVWFHGGGLSGGNKYIHEALKEKDICIVAANYRLHPRVLSPTYIEDAAAAVAWVFNNINTFGGDSSLIFVSGHSAGGYLASMVGLDKKWLKAFEIDANRIAGLIPFSGHTITHFTVRKERGLTSTQPLVDDLAPLFHVRADAPPLLLITGDRELEMMGRYEENAYLWRMMKVNGADNVELHELDGFNHGGMAGPGHALTLKFVERIKSQKPD